jgi:AraC-like DNA-binding protein
VALRPHEREYSGQKSPEFSHDAQQLGLARSGSVLIHTAAGTWTIPSGRGLWIPSRTRYAIEPAPAARLLTLYIYAARRDFRRQCAVLALTPLVREILNYLQQHATTPALTAVLCAQLTAERELPLFVPALSSPMAIRVAEGVIADHSERLRLRELAAALNVSVRTLERAFVADAGVPLGEWRQRARISRAIALLAGGMEVKDVALEVGYETPSAFVVAFRRYVGMTPGKLVPHTNANHRGL